MSESLPTALTSSHTLDYTYKRSLGPILSQFFTALRDGHFVGIKRSDGSVLMPPKEYDPDTSEQLDEMVDVADAGIVTSWSWVSKPREQQPLDHPFAYALVLLDGASTPFLHVVDAGSEAAMKTGMRVQAKWGEERHGAITDFTFVPA